MDPTSFDALLTEAAQTFIQTGTYQLTLVGAKHGTTSKANYPAIIVDFTVADRGTEKPASLTLALTKDSVTWVFEQLSYMGVKTTKELIALPPGVQATGYVEAPNRVKFLTRNP